MLNNKKILIGITGGIAAYKILILISKLIKQNCQIKVIMTKNAEKFITKLAVQTISQNKVYTDMFATDDFEIDHIALADWADLMIVAPATANIIGKFANGIADDLLSTTFLSFSSSKKIFIAPAMNSKMYENFIVRKNIEKLKESNKNLNIIAPDEGILACGAKGIGRLPEPEIILEYIDNFLYFDNLPLKGKKIVITAGPTREYIDPVRYISNDSSGAQGYAIANACAGAGADVILISGKVSNSIALINTIKKIDVIDSAEMFEAVKNNFKNSDIFISCAAVADYKPLDYSANKLKKDNDDLMLRLTKTQDILEWCGKNKKKQIIVGFAAETENLIENAKLKMQKKKCDLLIANSTENIGKSTNKIFVLSKDNIQEFSETAKQETAKIIVSAILKKINEYTN